MEYVYRGLRLQSGLFHLKRIFLMRGDKRHEQWKRLIFMAIWCPVVQHTVERRTQEAVMFFDIVQTYFKCCWEYFKWRLKVEHVLPERTPRHAAMPQVGLFLCSCAPLNNTFIEFF